MIRVADLSTLQVYDYFLNREMAESSLKRCADSVNGQYKYDSKHKIACISYTDINGFSRSESFLFVEYEY